MKPRIHLIMAAAISAHIICKKVHGQDINMVLQKKLDVNCKIELTLLNAA